MPRVSMEKIAKRKQIKMGAHHVSIHVIFTMAAQAP